MKKKILVIEDDLCIMRLIEYALDHEGFDVFVEHTGYSGLIKALRIKPDLVILDAMLPDLSAGELCLRLKEYSFGWKVPAIVISAKLHTERVSTSLHYTPDLCIHGTVEPDLLLNEVHELLVTRSKQDSSCCGARTH